MLISALAGEVVVFRGGPGDFDKWRPKNRDFDFARLPLKNAETHVLAPFDESKFQPMPDVELNPKDEFWVDQDKLDST